MGGAADGADRPAVGVLSTPAGRNRSAAFGTFSTLGFSAVTSLTFAVMPGRSLPSGFGTATTTV